MIPFPIFVFVLTSIYVRRVEKLTLRCIGVGCLYPRFAIPFTTLKLKFIDWKPPDFFPDFFFGASSFSPEISTVLLGSANPGTSTIFNTSSLSLLKKFLLLKRVFGLEPYNMNQNKPATRFLGYILFSIVIVISNVKITQFDNRHKRRQIRV